jgi:hypothetical protein
MRILRGMEAIQRRRTPRCQEMSPDPYFLYGYSMRILRGMEAIQRRRTPRCQEMSPDPYFPISCTISYFPSLTSLSSLLKNPKI